VSEEGDCPTLEERKDCPYVTDIKDNTKAIRELRTAIIGKDLQSGLIGRLNDIDGKLGALAKDVKVWKNWVSTLTPLASAVISALIVYAITRGFH
jgi:hypothetical protein